MRNFCITSAYTLFYFLLISVAISITFLKEKACFLYAINHKIFLSLEVFDVCVCVCVCVFVFVCVCVYVCVSSILFFKALPWKLERGMVEHKLQVETLKAGVKSLKAKIKTQKCKFKSTSYEFRIHELQVQLHELRVQVYELRVQHHQLRVQIHEFKNH